MNIIIHDEKSGNTITLSECEKVCKSLHSSLEYCFLNSSIKFYLLPTKEGETVTQTDLEKDNYRGSELSTLEYYICAYSKDAFDGIEPVIHSGKLTLKDALKNAQKFLKIYDSVQVINATNGVLVQELCN